MTRAQLMASTAILPPPDAPEPDGWYGAIDAGWDYDRGIVTLYDDIPPGAEVRVSYRVQAPVTSSMHPSRGMAIGAEAKYRELGQALDIALGQEDGLGYRQIAAAFPLEPDWAPRWQLLDRVARTMPTEGLATYRALNEQHRRRAGRASHGKVQVICPA